MPQRDVFHRRRRHRSGERQRLKDKVNPSDAVDLYGPATLLASDLGPVSIVKLTDGELDLDRLVSCIVVWGHSTWTRSRTGD